jgi:TonB family protein
MFTDLVLEKSARRRGVMAASLAAHAIFLAWLLHSPDPRLLNPSSVALGSNGRVLARIYFPTPSPDDSATSSVAGATEKFSHQRLAHEKLVLKANAALAKLPLPQKLLSPSTEDKSQTQTLSNLGHGAPAGLRYGSLPGGPIYGDEVRPALPIATVDPLVYPWQRPDSEGKVVIEITIDERGEIIRKTVLQSLGPEIDNKCLAALENWHFRPATQNGSPIASKQDAIFPFKARG